jgi:hypothetical protein
MDLILRKRICVRIYKRQSLKDSLMKRIWKVKLCGHVCNYVVKVLNMLFISGYEDTLLCDL